MQKKNMLAFIAGLIASIIAGQLVIEAGRTQATTPAPATATPRAEAPAKTLRNGCAVLYRQKYHANYASQVYRRATITKAARTKLKRLRTCARSAEAGRNMRAFEREQYQARRLRATAYCGTPYCNRNLGMILAAKRGWTGQQFACLDTLWGKKESGWKTTADNPHSSAYGIPQALPGSKMGPGWQSNPTVQISWGLSYIRGRYGTPCGALAHSNSVGWY